MTDSTLNKKYEPGMHPDLPPPAGTVGVIHWIKSNMLSSPINIFMTLVTAYLIYLMLPPAINFLFINAVFDAASRDECRAISSSGACWAWVGKRIGILTYGFYPSSEYWRVNIVFFELIIAVAPILFPKLPGRKYLLIHSAIYPLIVAIMLLGGDFNFLWLFSIDTGLMTVSTDKFGGMMLTLIVGATGIIFSFPIGLVLALGRQSDLPILKYSCIGFIEFIRGVPLITLLFVASTMLNYFLPPGTHFDLLLRVLIMVTLFSSAYIAEVIRGGLQAMPKGQYEAADALGLSYWQSMYKIILPQALKISIPGLVNTFIGLYKDSTLVIVIAMFDFLGMVRATNGDTSWNGVIIEGYIIVALFFFISCFSMSRYSLHLENKLHTGHKR